MIALSHGSHGTGGVWCFFLFNLFWTEILMTWLNLFLDQWTFHSKFGVLCFWNMTRGPNSSIICFQNWPLDWLGKALHLHTDQWRVSGNSHDRNPYTSWKLTFGTLKIIHLQRNNHLNQTSIIVFHVHFAGLLQWFSSQPGIACGVWPEIKSSQRVLFPQELGSTNTAFVKIQQQIL